MYIYISPLPIEKATKKTPIVIIFEQFPFTTYKIQTYGLII